MAGETLGGLANRLQIRVSEDRLRILADAVWPDGGFDEVAAALREELKKLGITDSARLLVAEYQFREAGAGKESISSALLLEGEPPLEPVDERIEWSRDFFEQGFALDEASGSVNYWEHLVRNNIETGERIGVLMPGQHGLAGRDVFGQPIPAPAPASLRLYPGKNVRYDGSTQSFYATSSGRLRIDHDAVVVDDILVIEGSVGLDTGHIRHSGSVVVNQNIEAGSRVETTGDICVLGYTEAAHIAAGGDLKVQGGITGKEGSVVRVGGNVHARFIQNVMLLAEGDVEVDREIDNAIVRTRGAVLLPNGRIVGGEVMALAGIEAGQIGCDAGIRTLVVAGEDYTLEDSVRAHDEEVETLRAIVDRIHAKLDPLRGREKSLPERSQEAVALLRQNLQDTEARLLQLDEHFRTIRDQSREKARHHIAVRQQLFADTLLRVGRAPIFCRECVPGPVVAQVRDGNPGLFTSR